MEQTIIIGIDPGSRITGYGIVAVTGSHQRHVAHGHIRTKSATLHERLQEIDAGLKNILMEYQPQQAAIEQVFTFHNHQAALKLGQARGAALVALSTFALPIAEYSARQVKQAVVGYGAATKLQIQQMVRALLRLTKTPTPDAADALAIALCHATSQRFNSRVYHAEGD